MVCPMFDVAQETSCISDRDRQATPKSVQHISRCTVSYCEMNFEVALDMSPTTQAILPRCNWLPINPWHHHDTFPW